MTFLDLTRCTTLKVCGFLIFDDRSLKFSGMALQGLGKFVDNMIWFDFCFTALRHILGYFGRGQLT